MTHTQNDFFRIENTEKQWKGIYTLGGIAAIIALTGILLTFTRRV